MFSLFRKKENEKPIQITNEFVGVMTFVDKTEHEDSFWIGAKVFQPIGRMVEYIIYNGIEGPSKSQIEVCTVIEEQYPTAIRLADPLVRTNFKESNFKLGENLVLSSLTILKEPQDTHDFSMTFELTDSFGFVEIGYKNWSPTHTWYSA